MLLAIPFGLICIISAIVLFTIQMKLIKKQKIDDNKTMFNIMILIISLMMYGIIIYAVLSSYNSSLPTASKCTSKCLGDNISASISFLITIVTSLVFGLIFDVIINKIFLSGSRGLSFFMFFNYYVFMIITSIILLLTFSGLLTNVIYNNIVTLLSIIAIVMPVLLYPLITSIKVSRIKE